MEIRLLPCEDKCILYLPNIIILIIALEFFSALKSIDHELDHYRNYDNCTRRIIFLVHFQNILWARNNSKFCVANDILHCFPEYHVSYFQVSIKWQHFRLCVCCLKTFSAIRNCCSAYNPDFLFPFTLFCGTADAASSGLAPDEQFVLGALR